MLSKACFELDGVIADGYREGLDNVSLSTIKRVRKTIYDYVEQPLQEPTVIGIDFAQDMWKSRMIEFLKEKKICSFDNNKIVIEGWIQELEKIHE